VNGELCGKGKGSTKGQEKKENKVRAHEEEAKRAKKETKRGRNTSKKNHKKRLGRQKRGRK
jgi:hypothetical protein